MASGVWLIVVIPAVIAFLFGIYVTVSMINDVANRDQTIIDPLQGVIKGGPPPGAQ